jgi:formylglycine-generating enzyme required for sulfatase activity
MDQEPNSPKQEVATAGGAYIEGDIETSHGDLIGRDQQIYGDKVGRDQVGRDVYHVAAQQVLIQQYQTTTQEFTNVVGNEKPAPGESPYKGLEFFDVGDAAIFFGREQLTAELVARLRHHRLLAVVGASGSGKSSVVRAGLVPALQHGQPLADGSLPPEGSTRWPVHILTPTGHPLKALAASLTRDSESVTATTTLLDDLTHETRSLDLYVNKILSRGEAQTRVASDRLLLVVDQFEELFTLCKDRNERKAFVDNLLTATTSDSQTVVVLTLRADFYGHCAEFENLRQVLANHQAYIGPMQPDELRRAIEGPALLGGWEFEPGLIELMLQDAGEEPGALPLISHALLETWNRRRGRMLTFAGYTESGRVQGAIAETANRVYIALTPEQQQIARTIFLHLTELGEGTQDTRRRVELDELVPRSNEQSNVEGVLKLLADSRLVTTFQMEVEVAHEALIREWPTLRAWLAENREWLRIHRRLTAAAHEWEAQAYNPDLLYRRTILEQSLENAKGHEQELNELEQKFLKASRVSIEAARDAEEEARQRELKQAQAIIRAAEARRDTEERRSQDAEASTKRLRWVAALAIMAVVMTGVFIRQAQLNAKIAQERMNQLRVLLQVDSIKDLDMRRQLATLMVQLGEESAAVRNWQVASTNFQKALALEPPPDTPVYVWVPPGEFIMGPSDQEQTMYIDGFWIMRTEVTNAQYKRCVAANVCKEPDNNEWNQQKFANRPVTNVTQGQARRYASWVGGRLPTGEEWEKACRGTDGRIHPWGNEATSPDRLADPTFIENVGSYPPGAHGLYDMAGNAGEWVEDTFMVRAGSLFVANINCVAEEFTSMDSNYSGDFYGFRVVSPWVLPPDSRESESSSLPTHLSPLPTPE